MAPQTNCTWGCQLHPQSRMLGQQQLHHTSSKRWPARLAGWQQTPSGALWAALRAHRGGATIPMASPIIMLQLSHLPAPETCVQPASLPQQRARCWLDVLSITSACTVEGSSIGACAKDKCRTTPCNKQDCPQESCRTTATTTNPSRVISGGTSTDNLRWHAVEAPPQGRRPNPSYS